jgi:hypothetical protein
VLVFTLNPNESEKKKIITFLNRKSQMFFKRHSKKSPSGITNIAVEEA